MKSVLAFAAFLLIAACSPSGTTQPAGDQATRPRPPSTAEQDCRREPTAELQQRCLQNLPPGSTR